MSYVRDNGLARARRRRERRSLAILVLCALLVLGSIVFAATFMAHSGKKSSACASRSRAAANGPGSFVLNVYNAGGQKGAAGAAAEALRTHGLQVGVVGNDPYRRDVKGPGEVRFGPGGASNAHRFVASLTPGTQLVQDGRDGTSIDVVVGPQFPTVSKVAATPSASTSCS